MRLRTWPAESNLLARWTLAPSSHSRGHTGDTGHGSYERGPGARIVGTVDIPALCIADALKLRAFFHSLRGPYGTFYLLMPRTSGGTDANTQAPYTDGTYFSDGTTYHDLVGGSGLSGLNAATAADADTITMYGAAPHFVVGAWLVIGDVSGTGQLVQIVSVSGSTSCTVRPRLRSAQPSGANITYDTPVYGLFRLAGDVPIIPLINGRSLPFSVDIEEAY